MKFLWTTNLVSTTQKWIILNSVQPSKLLEKMIQFHKDDECHLSKLHLLGKKRFPLLCRSQRGHWNNFGPGSSETSKSTRNIIGMSFGSVTRNLNTGQKQENQKKKPSLTIFQMPTVEHNILADHWTVEVSVGVSSPGLCLTIGVTVELSERGSSQSA